MTGCHLLAIKLNPTKLWKVVSNPGLKFQALFACRMGEKCLSNNLIN